MLCRSYKISCKGLPLWSSPLTLATHHCHRNPTVFPVVPGRYTRPQVLWTRDRNALLDLIGYCTTMEPALPIIEVVIFHANERCLGDPGLFKEVRDMVAATTRCVQPGPRSPSVSRSDSTTHMTQREGHVLGTFRRITQGHLLAIR